MSSTVNFTKRPVNASQKFEIGDTTTLKALNTAFAQAGDFDGGGVMTAMYITNDDDTNPYWVQIHRTIGGTDFLLATIYVPAKSGLDDTASHVEPLDVLSLGLFGSSLNHNNQYELPMDETIIYKVGMLATVGAGKTVTVNADFKKY